MAPNRGGGGGDSPLSLPLHAPCPLSPGFGLTSTHSHPPPGSFALSFILPHFRQTTHRPIVKCLKILHVNLFNHVKIRYHQTGHTSQQVHPEHISVSFAIIFDLQMHLAFMSDGIEHVTDKWKSSRSWNFVSEGVFQDTKRSNAPGVDNENYEGSDCDRPPLRCSLLIQVEEIHCITSFSEVGD